MARYRRTGVSYADDWDQPDPGLYDPPASARFGRSQMDGVSPLIGSIPKAVTGGVISAGAHKFVQGSSWKRAGISGVILAGSSYFSSNVVALIPGSIRSALGALESDVAASLVTAVIISVFYRRKKEGAGSWLKQCGVETLYGLGSLVAANYVTPMIGY